MGFTPRELHHWQQESLRDWKRVFLLTKIKTKTTLDWFREKAQRKQWGRSKERPSDELVAHPFSRSSPQIDSLVQSSYKGTVVCLPTLKTRGSYFKALDHSFNSLIFFFTRCYMHFKNVLWLTGKTCNVYVLTIDVASTEQKLVYSFKSNELMIMLWKVNATITDKKVGTPLLLQCR